MRGVEHTVALVLPHTLRVAYLVFDSVEKAALSRASLAQQTYSNRVVSTSDSGDPGGEARIWHARHVSTCSSTLYKLLSLSCLLRPLLIRRGST